MAGAQGLEPWARGFGEYAKTLIFQGFSFWVTPWVTSTHIYSHAAYLKAEEYFPRLHF